MKAGVPITAPARDSDPGASERTVRTPAAPSPAAASFSTLASPQSMTCTSPNAPTMTFSGLRSRWITRREWA